MILLSASQRRALRARAHALNPVASIAAKGLAASVLAEIDRALNAHELVKIRVYGEARNARDQLLEQLCEALGCAPVQHIGHILVVFRPRQEAAPDQPTRAPLLPHRTPSRTTRAGRRRQG